MMNKLLTVAATLLVCGLEPACPAACEGDECGPSEGEGEGEQPPCVIGDETAPAELELVFRTVDGQIEKLDDGDEIPLILPVQGGKVIYVGVRGRNVSCRVQLTGGMFDTCADPQVLVGVEGRPVLLTEGAPGVAEPVNDPTDIIVTNFANVPMCPTFASSQDSDRGVFRLEMRVTEQRRVGEQSPRVHTLSALARPVCAEPANAEDCACECDADFVLEKTREEQCPTIHDNDPPDGACPAGG